MKARELTDAQVADILGLSETTVRIYRCKTECSKTIPARALELLELRTAKSDVAQKLYDSIQAAEEFTDNAVHEALTNPPKVFTGLVPRK